MRKTKRFAAAVAALAMAVSMVAASSTMTAFAAVGSSKITVSETNPNSYVYYQIFVGNFETPAGSDKPVLMADSDLGFGSGVNAAKLYEALHIPTEKQNVANALAAFDGLTADRVLEILAEEDVLSGTGTTLAKNTVGTNVPNGYYYIVETDANNNDNTGDILKVVNQDVNVTAKVGTPKVEKKIQENIKNAEKGSVIDNNLYEDKFNDAADFCIGDRVPFQIVGTLPADFDTYDKYFYKFTDRLYKGITPPAANGITVTAKTGETTVTLSPDVVKVIENQVAGNDEYTEIRIIFNNLKSVQGLTAESKIIVNYTGVLNNEADLTAKGNTNDVELRYTTDKAYDGEGYGEKQNDEEDERTEEEKEQDKQREEDETGHTTKDGVVAFTYTVDVTKVDKDADTTKLAGATFVLGKGSGENTQYAVIDANNKFVKWTSDIDYNESDGKVKFTTEADGKFVIAGLDDGDYFLRETNAPDGYNLLKDDVAVKIRATINNTGDWDYVNFNGTDAFGGVEEATDSTPFQPDGTVLKANVGNAKGAELPETGGIGTTMFYVGGGVLAAAAGTVLIAKKRAKKED